MAVSPAARTRSSILCTHQSFCRFHLLSRLALCLPLVAVPHVTAQSHAELRDLFSAEFLRLVVQKADESLLVQHPDFAATRLLVHIPAWKENHGAYGHFLPRVVEQDLLKTTGTCLGLDHG